MGMVIGLHTCRYPPFGGYPSRHHMPSGIRRRAKLRSGATPDNYLCGTRYRVSSTTLAASDAAMAADSAAICVSGLAASLAARCCVSLFSPSFGSYIRTMYQTAARDNVAATARTNTLRFVISSPALLIHFEFTPHNRRQHAHRQVAMGRTFFQDTFIGNR